jgi:hypothetical protein
MLAAISSIMALLLLCSGSLAQTVTKPSVPHDACTTPEQKHLDFWLGEWDLTWPGGKTGRGGSRYE